MEWTTSNWFKEWEILAKKEYHHQVPEYRWILVKVNGNLEWKLIKQN